ncbi:MAG: RecB family exonuclease, partial [Bacteroidota bacterium]
MQSNDLVAPEFLSPSSINTFRQCPLKFKYSKIDGLRDPSGQEAILGNFVHDILEELYNLPPDQRTMEEAKFLARKHWEAKWRAEIMGIIRSEKELNRFRWAAWWCVENLWMLENPTEVTLSGTEKFVRGEIGGVKVHGFIDRYLARDGISTVGDYKTGKTPKERDLDDKFFQLIIYSQLLSTIGVETEENFVELLYLKDGVRFKRSLN